MNTLRFYAAMSVVIVHISTNFAELRSRAAVYPLLDALVIDAQTAVSLFFVLSGFLITYLLLFERQETGVIRVGQFYLRRILRIWPLYYLVAFIGFGIFPPLLGIGYEFSQPPLRSILLVVFLLPNLVGPLGPLGHLWTIGLEEQFYLFWPWAAKSDGRLLRVIGGIIFLKLVLAPVVAAFNSDAMTNLFLGSRFECMAVGAAGAYLVFHRYGLLQWLYKPLVQIVVLIGFGYLMLQDIPVTAVNNLLVSILFITFIINVATNPRPLLRLECPLSNYLGIRSYGLYMVHFPVLYLVLYSLREMGIPEGDLYTFILYSTTISMSLGLALISYRGFERPFLRLKEHLSPRLADQG